MLRSLTYIFLFFILSLNNLNSNETFVPPKIEETPDILGHIFKDDRGHFAKDTPENRNFIHSAAARLENRVGINNFGQEIYLNTMPDGSQAWAFVYDGTVRDGGKNNFPKEWVKDSSFQGGAFHNPKIHPV